MRSAQRIGPLFTDFYELTMAAGYYEHRLFSDATFSVFVRNYPINRSYFVAAGLEDALRGLAAFRFSDSELSFLKKTGHFSNDFISYLKRLRFTGRIHALPEGTIFFAGEPVMEVTAPIIEAQLIETFLLNTLGLQTILVSKAARCVYAAEGRPLIDFSLRRTQGRDAGMKIARSTYIAGFDRTSNVLAGKVYGIPLSGTMAHSFISAFDREIDAFAAFSKTFPHHSVFLIDTYDTIEGAHNAVKVAKEMEKRGASLAGVRLDSGDMVVLSRKVRRILDDAGLHQVKIFASSGFDEYKIADVIAGGAKIDAFGVGTKVGVSNDAPYFDIVYKLVRYKDRNVRKLSSDKITLAGEKQVFRQSDKKGRYIGDVIGLRDETIENHSPLLEKAMENGKPLRPNPSLQIIRERFKSNFAFLDEKYKTLEGHASYPVKLSTRLEELQNRL